MPNKDRVKIDRKLITEKVKKRLPKIVQKRPNFNNNH